MSVNRSGYYKWPARKDAPNRYKQDRITLRNCNRKKKAQTYPVTLHPDQGSVYSSAGLYQIHKNYANIKRSISRAGIPNGQSDNRIIKWTDKRRNENGFNLKNIESIPYSLKTMYITSIMKDYLTN